MISVIIPAYNSEKYVSQAVESVINQTYTDWELIAVDDGSSDNTGKILDNYASKDSRIKVIHQKNCGVSAARNTGLDNATGKWVMFLDSDDYYGSDALEYLLNRSENQDVVIGTYVNLEDNKTRELFDISLTTREEIRDTFIEQYSKGTYASVCDKLFIRKLLTHRFHEDISAAEDTFFNIELLKKKPRIRIVPKQIIYYRHENSDSLSSRWINYSPKLYGFFYRTVENQFHRYTPISTYCRKYFVTSFISFTNKVLNANNMDSETKTMMINDVLGNDYFNSLPLEIKGLNPDTMHKYIILKTKDLKLIEETLK